MHHGDDNCANGEGAGDDKEPKKRKKQPKTTSGGKHDTVVVHSNLLSSEKKKKTTVKLLSVKIKGDFLVFVCDLGAHCSYAAWPAMYTVYR